MIFQGGDAGQGARLQHGAAGIAAHAHGRLRAKLTDDAARLPLAAQQLGDDGDVLPQVPAVKSGHGQADDAVARVGHALHLHAAFGADEEDVRIGAQGLQRVGDGDGGEDVSARAASADDDAESGG